MSKVNELRKKAIQAVRAQGWDEAVKLYERVCGLDNTNASYRNELGDIYLKKGEIPSAIAAFESAVELYMAVGLTNNAIAAHKKILRHNPGHMDSLWGLGEIRRRQNLEADAAAHFLEFLCHFQSVDPRYREKFLDRCSLLMDNLPGDLQILSELEKIFQSWEMADEHARVLVLKATLAQESGETDMVEKYVERARELMPQIDSLPEYRSLRGESGSAATPSSDPEPAEDDAVDLTSISGEIDLTEMALGDEEGVDFLDLGLELEDDPDETEPSVPQAPEGLSPVFGETEAPEVAREEYRPDLGEEATGEEPTTVVDPLDEILSSGGLDASLSEAERRQVNGIAHEVQGQIAAHVSEDDHKGQYEVGIVYMDMGLFDQAVEAFTRAADGDDHRLKALEMKGSCLTRLGRLEEALATFQEGLAIPGYPGRYYLGLLYEVGVCLEGLGRIAEARDHYQRVAAVDQEFLDVGQRLQRLDEGQPSVP